MDGVVRNIEIPRKPRLSEFDYFSEGIGISYGGMDRGKSIPGFFFTMFLFGCFIFLFQYYLTNTLDTSSPKLRYDVITDSSSLNFNASNSDFKLFFLFSDPTLKVLTKTSSLESLPDTFDASALDEEAGGEAGAAEEDLSGFVPEEVRRLLVEGTARRSMAENNVPKDNFLDFANREKFFDIKVNYVKTESTVSKGQRVIKKTQFPINLIPCSNATWFKNETLAPFLDKNKFAKEIIGSNGYCLDIGEKVNVYGNWLSSSDSFISIDVNLCDPTKSSTCDANVWKKYKDNDQLVHMGSFSSNVDNTNKDDPFVYDFTFHDSFFLSTQTVNIVNIRYKRMEMKTDFGIMFDDFDTKSVGVIEDISIKNINAIIYDKTSNTFTAPTVQTLATFEIRGTSRIDQYTRSYDKVFDFFGNLGGAMELVFLVATLSYAYLDSFLTDRKVRKICMTELGLDRVKLPSEKVEVKKTVKRCAGCSKKKTEHEEQLDSYAEEMAESTLSFERMVRNNLMAEILQETVVPPALLKVAPYLLALEKAKKDKAEAEKNAAKATNKVQNTKTEKVAAIEVVDIKSIEIKEEVEPNFDESLQFLMSRDFDLQYPAFVKYKEKYAHLIPNDLSEKIRVSEKNDYPIDNSDEKKSLVKKGLVTKRIELHDA